MKSIDQTNASLNNLQVLPAFAQFLLTEKLDSYSRKQLELGYQMQVPLLKFFNALPEEERLSVTQKAASEFLEFLAANKAHEYIQTSIERFKTNHLTMVDRDSIVGEDLTLITYLRKKSLLHFIPDYTRDAEMILALVNEIDFYLNEMLTTATNTYIDLLKERIGEHSHFIQKVNETLPGAVYVFDVKENKGIYSNNKFSSLTGYEQAELNQLGSNVVDTLIHPDDREVMRMQWKALLTSQDGETFVCQYRVRDKNGNYRWLADYLAVFKRAEDGSVSEGIGITLDISNEQQIIAENQSLIKKLSRSEALYKKAEEIANMGNWVWYLKKGRLEWTDQLYRIYGLEPQSEVMTIERFLSFVHPDDREFVTHGVDALNYESSLDYTFRIITADGTLKWLRSLAHVIKDKEGRVSTIIGIEQDVTEKQKLIGKLQESQQLFKQAQALAHLGNWTYDLQTGEIIWSDELYAIYEREKGKPLTADEWFSYLTPEENEKIQAQFQQAITENKAMEIVHSIQLPSGKRKMLHRKGEAIYDRNGKAVKLAGTTQDVTEQFKVQAELRESQNFIRKITDATPSIITTYNTNTGVYTFVSEGLEKLLGYKTAEALEKGVGFFTAIIHPEDLEHLLEKNARAVEKAGSETTKTDMVAEFTYRIKHKNGTWRWLHTYGTVFDYNKEGKVEHILNISLDVTDQMQASEKIKEQEHFIQQIADASPTILYLFDVPMQRMAYINREAFFVLGYLPDEILEEGANITDFLYHPEDLPLLPCRRQSSKTFQQVDSMIQYECRMKHKDGDYRWLLVREIVFKTNESGEITQIIGAALDINRRKEMERTILQNTLQLEQSNASLEEFAYVASHDLKEPLRKISTFGDRLVASQIDRLSDDGKIYLRKIVDASQRMQNMISDLLSISMISGNHAFERYSLKKILEEIVQTLEYKIESQGAIIRYDDLPEINIIPSQFRQLFQNLLSNSLKFVREGVQPLVIVSCTEADAYEVAPYQLPKADRYLKITFTDNGIGFENEYAQKIFAIFQRLHGRSEYEGSGIGLAICKKIVEHHRGVIFAQGKPGEGATFTIILPA